MAKEWASEVPEKCQFCNQPLKNVFYDMNYKFMGWGIGCEDCHKEHGVGLGIGRGQMFDLKTRKMLAGGKNRG